MKIKDTVQNPFEEGLFYDIHELIELGWFSTELTNSLNTEYYLGHSGEKEISPLFNNLKKLEDEMKISSANRKLAQIIVDKYKDKWNKLYEAIVASYSPIENYNMEEIETPELTTTSSTHQASDVSTTASQDASNYGFNSSQANPTAKQEQTSRQQADANNNFVDSSSTQTGQRKLIRHGNIGVTMSSEIIKGEIDLRAWNFYDAIFKDVDSELALAIYL